jgi:hypothetical protein
MAGDVNIREIKTPGKARSTPDYIQRLKRVQLVCPQLSYNTCGCVNGDCTKIALGTLQDKKTQLNQERCEKDN